MAPLIWSRFSLSFMNCRAQLRSQSFKKHSGYSVQVGTDAIVDNNPKSPVIQNLPPVLFTLMKSTEPWSDDYYTFNVETAMQSVGFERLVTVASDPHHRKILGRKS